MLQQRCLVVVCMGGELHCAYQVSLDLDESGWPGQTQGLWLCQAHLPDFAGAVKAGLMGVALASAGRAQLPAGSQRSAPRYDTQLGRCPKHLLLPSCGTLLQQRASVDCSAPVVAAE